MMGINLQLKFESRPTDQQLMELQYGLMHRFGPESFKMIADGGKKVPFVGLAESGPGEHWVEIAVRGGYYRIDFECGDGLKITAMLLHLCRNYPEAEIWYRPETDADLVDEEFKIDEEKALNLLSHFLDHGSLPFLKAMTRFQNREGVESPLCPFCGGPMMRNPGRLNTAHFFCAGCDEEIKYEGVDYHKWVREQKRLSSLGSTDDDGVFDEEPF